MYLPRYLHLVGTFVILQQAWAQLSLFQRYNLSESLFQNDILPLDYEIDDRLNSSVLMDLDANLTQKLFSYDSYNKRSQRALAYKLETLDTSFKRMFATSRSKNVIVLGLRYEPTWPKICEQLRHLTKHFGFKFQESHIAAYNQERLPLRPVYSRLVLTFKKITTKQVYLLKFKEKLEEYEKLYRINSRTRKICRIANLGECEIYLQDDITTNEKLLLSSLRKLQRSYPKLFNCYVKDSKVFYKLVNKIRPTIIDRQKDILALERILYQMSKSGIHFPKVRQPSYRSGTAFPYDLIQYNRTRRKGLYPRDKNHTARVPTR
uniref:Uncharacterized protein n=1 Tax=Cacopsylla melanoneura TaxID=428564 RepID=A0A8D8YVP9_9HEMI